MIRKQVGHSLQPATPQVRIKLSYVKLAEITEIGIQSLWLLYEHYIYIASSSTDGFTGFLVDDSTDRSGSERVSAAKGPAFWCEMACGLVSFAQVQCSHIMVLLCNNLTSEASCLWFSSGQSDWFISLSSFFSLHLGYNSLSGPAYHIIKLGTYPNPNISTIPTFYLCWIDPHAVVGAVASHYPH